MQGQQSNMDSKSTLFQITKLKVVRKIVLGDKKKASLMSKIYVNSFSKIVLFSENRKR